MLIAISALHFTPGRPGAPIPYLTSLVRSLSEIDRENQYVLFTRPRNRSWFPLDRPNFREVVFPEALENVGLRVLCEQVVVPLVLLWKRADVYHFPATVGVLLSPCKSVGTIHMVPDRVLQRSMSLVRRIYYGVLGRWTARTATRLIAVSQSSREELLQWCAVPPGKISVVHEGVEECFSPAQREAIQPFKQRFGVGEKYILAVVTNVSPHENLEAMFDAYIRFRTVHGHPHQLVLVGHVPPEYPREQLLRLSRECGAELAKDVICTGFLPYSEMPPIYAGATLFLQVSLRESFGLTVLEAMASGVPVIVTNFTALPEIAGDAGILVDPHDPEAIAHQMHRIVSDESVAADVREKGIRRAREFSWKKVARETLEVYRQALQPANGLH